jgi:acyl-CoA synthetase (AMP-forming)/AMP-acid ligase II
MNVFDYFFDQSKILEKNFILGPKEQASYLDIYNTSLKLASYLNKKIGINKNVLIVSENSFFFIVAYLSVLKSGNVCIPINPGLEGKLKNQIINESKPDLAFVSKRYRRAFTEFQPKIIDSSDISSVISEIDFDKGHQSGNFDDNTLAEIIYTSGSTGEQKGVMISHKNIIANTESILQYLKLSNNDIIEVVMPFYYCYGLSLLHTHLRVGGSVVLNNSFIFLGSVINDLKKFKCTGFSGVPSHFQILLRKSKDFKSMQFPSLRYVTQAGGKLYDAFITEFTEAFPEIKFFVMYGQTEATARLSYLEPEMLKSKMGSIGKGIPGVELKIVNDDLEEVNIGEEGEIIAKGDNIMKGYYNDQKLSKKTILNGWLFTGDNARRDSDGYIFITGRKKEIIKVGGVRMSPKEIEDVIVRHPLVIDCRIRAENEDILGEQLAATIYISDDSKAHIMEKDIKEHCMMHLSKKKVPTIIRFETKLPFNSSGKKSL